MPSSRKRSPVAFPLPRISRDRLCFWASLCLPILIKKKYRSNLLILLNQGLAGFGLQPNPAKILDRKNLFAKYWIDWAWLCLFAYSVVKERAEIWIHYGTNRECGQGWMSHGSVDFLLEIVWAGLKLIGGCERNGCSGREQIPPVSLRSRVGMTRFFWRRDT
jgi:hypothetical protein